MSLAAVRRLDPPSELHRSPIPSCITVEPYRRGWDREVIMNAGGLARKKRVSGIGDCNNEVGKGDKGLTPQFRNPVTGPICSIALNNDRNYIYSAFPSEYHSTQRLAILLCKSEAKQLKHSCARSAILAFLSLMAYSSYCCCYHILVLYIPDTRS